MLSYRHAFHAGNHADVLKHALLLQVLRHLNRKDKPWGYVDTHAGAGLYALDSEYALKNAEFAAGIGRLWQRHDLPAALQDYVELVRRLNPEGRLGLYPGSPWFARQLMRADDQLRLYELHSTDSRILQQTLGEPGRHVIIEAADGYAALKAVLPPPSRRGLVLMDPAYELKDDYRSVLDALKEGLKRFATGIYAVWYPQLQRPESRDFPERLKRLPVHSWLHAALTVQTPSTDGFGMHGSGVFVINPPWQLAEQLAEVLPYLSRVLAVDTGAAHVLESHIP